MHAWPGSAPQVSAGIRHLGLFPTSVGFYPHEERGKGGAQWMGHCQRGIHGSGHAFSAWVAAGCKAPPVGMLGGSTGPAARTAAAIVGMYTEEIHGAPSLCCMDVIRLLDRWCGGTCDPHVQTLSTCTLWHSVHCCA